LEKDLNELTNEELIKEFQDNNTIEAYKILVKRFKDPLMNYVYRFVGDKDAASDIVQNTMLKFYLNKDTYKSFAKFSTWIYTIAGNLAKNELKRRKRRTILSLDKTYDNDKPIQIADPKALSPERFTDSAMLSEYIQKALMKIRKIYREVVVLRDIQGLSYEEISEITGLTLGTVKSRINRGRTQLQKLLKGIYSE